MTASGCHDRAAGTGAAAPARRPDAGRRGRRAPAGGRAVAELCRRLDGLPLALELAAGRAAPWACPACSMPSDGGRALGVLRGGRRTASPRHRSLPTSSRGPTGCSTSRSGPCSSGSRCSRARWSTAPRSRSAETPGTARPRGPVPGRPAPGEPPRFGMLETLRAFGRSRFAGDPAATRPPSRHAAWAVRLADEVTEAGAAPGSRGHPGVRRPSGRLRQAHAWLCSHGPVDACSG